MHKAVLVDRSVGASEHHPLKKSKEAVWTNVEGKDATSSGTGSLDTFFLE